MEWQQSLLCSSCGELLAVFEVFFGHKHDGCQNEEPGVFGENAHRLCGCVEKKVCDLADQPGQQRAQLRPPRSFRPAAIAWPVAFSVLVIELTTAPIVTLAANKTVVSVTPFF